MKVIETKLGIVAEVGGVFGHIKGSTFIPYTPEELERKTAYKRDWGWMEFESIDAYQADRKSRDTARRIENAIFQEKMEQRKAENLAKAEQLIASGTIEATVANIRLVLIWLNSQNWGYWKLPAMTIGYKAAQYDCDGKQASTITLAQPISDEEWEVHNETRFAVDAPRGYLDKYQRL